ncbi:hypothetical protein EV426DRAFT_715299 [Tirmania nivea]|nr:hypothetical protein EV426DRAFT_715299 [Tirmania nivea]
MDRQETTYASRQESSTKRGTKKVVLAKAIHRKSPSSRRKEKLPTTSGLRLQALLPMPADVVIRPELDMDIPQPSLGDPKLRQNTNHGDLDPPHLIPFAKVSDISASGQLDAYSRSGSSEPLIQQLNGVGYAFPSAALLPSVENNMSMHTMMTEWNPETLMANQSTVASLPSIPWSLPFGASQTNQHDSTHLRHCPTCAYLWRKLRDSIMGIIRVQEGARGGASFGNGGAGQMPEKHTTELLGSFFAFEDHWHDHAGGMGRFGPSKETDLSSGNLRTLSS